MKKCALNLLSICGLIAILLTSCKEEETPKKKVVKEDPKVEEPAPIIVAEANMSLINKMTATWCGPCGTWGWELFESIIEANKANAVIMGTYGSGSSNYYNEVAEDLKKAQAPTAGWPAFCVNGSNKTEYSPTGGIYTTTTQDNVTNAVNDHKSNEVMVSAGYRMDAEGDTVKMTVKTKFFRDGDDGAQYYMGVYVMEDKVVGYQSGRGNSASHHHVLRGSLTGNTFGVLIENGNKSGATFEQSFELIPDATWNKDNLEYAVVIWKKLGVRYLFVNAFQDNN